MKTDFLVSCRAHLHPLFEEYGLGCVLEVPDCPEEDVTHGCESVDYAGSELLISVSLSWGKVLRVGFVRVDAHRDLTSPIRLSESDAGLSLQWIRKLKGHGFFPEEWSADSWDQPIRQVANAVVESASDLLSRDFSNWPELIAEMKKIQRKL